MGPTVAVAAGITSWMHLPLAWCRLSVVLGSVPLVRSIKLLELGDSEVLLENYVIEYYDTPFNYIDIDTSVATSQILQINNSPPCWWFVKNSSSFDITISPQINGTSSYDSTNEFVITNNTTCVLCITPGSPPLTDTLQNPTCMKLI